MTTRIRNCASVVRLACFVCAKVQSGRARVVEAKDTDGLALTFCLPCARRIGKAAEVGT